MESAAGAVVQCTVVASDLTINDVPHGRQDFIMHRTRIKICGLRREKDVQSAVTAGADAIGLVFYRESPRYIAPADAGRLISAVPPFFTTTGLFVNAGV